MAAVNEGSDSGVFTVRLAPPPRDARWDPSTLPDDEDDEPQWTEIQIAAHYGDLDKVNEIVSRCDDDQARKAEVVNASPAGWYGQTALQAACMHEHIEVVKALLDAGADIAAPGGNNIYRNAFEYACGTGNLALVSLLLAAGAAPLVNPQKVTRYQGRTPIQAAAEVGSAPVVTHLLDLGANINAPPSPAGGLTALQAAALNGHTQLIPLLLAQGADVNAPPCKEAGYTALQAACRAGECEIVALLLDAGADVNARPGKRGGLALHAAAEAGELEIVRILLDAGADVNGKVGLRGQTAVQSAFLAGRENVVALLRERGALGALNGGRLLFSHIRTRTWSMGSGSESERGSMPG